MTKSVPNKSGGKMELILLFNPRFTDFRVVKHGGVNVPDLLHCT